MWFLRFLARYAKHILISLLLLWLSFVLVTWPLPTPEQPAPPGIDFLMQQYDAELGLLRESPETAPDRHWIATDNWLAARAFNTASVSPMADRITRHMDTYNAGKHGLIEVLDGEVVQWPPGTANQYEVAPNVWMETRGDTARMHDWQDYVDLAFYGALNAYNAGNVDLARRRYRRAIQHFDGIGFADKAYDGRYATYKLARALYVGDVLGDPPPDNLRRLLLSKRAGSGGFTALYNSEGTPVGDANTETTSYAILALSRLRQ